VLRGASWSDDYPDGICLLPLAATSSLIIVAVISGFVVLWRLSLGGEAGLFPFALLSFYLLRQPRSGRFFMRETPPLYTVAGQLVGWTLDRTADFPKSQRFTFGQRVDNLDCLQQVVRAIYSTGNQRHRYLSELNFSSGAARLIGSYRSLPCVAPKCGWCAPL
jgi:hypothetical protein